MLLLKKIIKKYDSNDNEVIALRGVSIEFRKNEFVSILGHSGCGKTTLLNIIGGLDQYTSGDLMIGGVSTKDFKDSDWDIYRNHSIGFVFQSYNLIPHQTVLSNVELALTLSGVSRAERSKRAKDALEKVGLGDQINKKPNQLSGGQMQRVAIARALVNDPEILLADEPTGALDSDTSVQIMEILKEVAKDKLVIMVTHNPELAERYSTRIVKLVDGNIVSDSMPYDSSAEVAQVTPDNTDASADRNVKKSKKKKKTSMAFTTALSLSLNNLMTKKVRTFLTSFAGSIGIIGIALILSMQTGIQAYIRRVQEDTLSSYPITISSEPVQLNELLSSVMSQNNQGNPHDNDKVYSSAAMYNMAKAMFNVKVHTNDLESLKKAFEADEELKSHVSDIQYIYSQTLHIYSKDPKGELVKVNPSSIMKDASSMMAATMPEASAGALMMSSGLNVCSEIIDNKDVLDGQYDILAGRWPEKYDEVVLVVDKNNELNDVYMYSLGLKDPDEIEDIIKAAINGEEYDDQSVSFTYDELLNKTFSLVLPGDFYTYDEETSRWTYMGENETYVDYLAKTGVELKITGVVKPAVDSIANSISGAIGYTHALSEYVLEHNLNTGAVKAQLEDPTIDIFENLPFDDGTLDKMTAAQKANDFKKYLSTLSDTEKADIYKEIVSTPSKEELDAMTESYMSKLDLSSREKIIAFIISNAGDGIEGLPPSYIQSYLDAMTDDELSEFIRSMIRQKAEEQFKEMSSGQLAGLTDKQLAALLSAKIDIASEGELAKMYDDFMPPQYSDSTLKENKEKLEISNKDIPYQINIYASTFEDKDAVTNWINEYNNKKSADGEENTIKYTDFVGLLMSGVTRIVDIVSVVLIAFVAISLVVSSIMIGVITYISVIERTKEIGILRAIGASKKDISRVFNAETTIIGLISGALGILITLLLLIPTNIIVQSLTGVHNIAQLPIFKSAILVALSVMITLIAGLVPSSIAAKKDPVVALRTE